MPGLVPGISTRLATLYLLDRDGRDKPGHDAKNYRGIKNSKSQP
jgi:hypothetical protein